MTTLPIPPATELPGPTAEDLKSLEENYRSTAGDWARIPAPAITDDLRIEFQRHGLRTMYNRPKVLRFVLRHIYDLEFSGPKDYPAWLADLIKRCGWENIEVKSVNRQLTELEKKEYLSEWRGDRNKWLGYVLGDIALDLLNVQSFRHPTPSVVLGSPVIDYAAESVVLPALQSSSFKGPVPDLGELLVRHAEAFMELATVSDSIRQNRSKREELRRDADRQVAELDLEYESLKGRAADNLPGLKDFLK